MNDLTSPVAPNSSYTCDFVRWLAEVLPRLIVHLRIDGSPRTPGGVSIDVVGVEAVLHAYRWRAEWERADGSCVESLDWPSTKRSLTELRDHLREAAGTGDDRSSFAICEQILQWGGERNRATGARPFLKRLTEERRLAAYITDVGRSLKLEADVPLISKVERMNSMLTKVHALYATDGLPIYDSRVAATAAALSEAYRRLESPKSIMPNDLRFPSVGGGDQKHQHRRRIRRLFPDAEDQGTVPYASTQTSMRWSNAKWRLGRILRGVVRRKPGLFAYEGGEAARMHALEAAFFMVGYDVMSLRALRD